MYFGTNVFILCGIFYVDRCRSLLSWAHSRRIYSVPSDLSDHCAITVSMLLEFAVQIAHGLLYLESQSFVHGDLAACNVIRVSPQQACFFRVFF